MQYPFTLYGRMIQIHRYKVTYNEEILGTVEDGEPVLQTVERVRRCNTREQAEAVAAAHNGIITELDSATYEWLDGIEVADVPDTYAEAVKLYEAGQAAYEAELSKPTPEEQAAALEQQVTDLQMALCDMYEAMEKG